MSEAVSWVFDGLLVIALVIVAARVVFTPVLFKAIVMFIVFGLLMAIAWGRLDAPHVALAEAAIGAGITGALLLAAYSDLVSVRRRRPHLRPRVRVLRRHAFFAASAALAFAALALVLLQVPAPESGAGTLAVANLDATGVAEGVTAVLLDFRAYDTLLEMAVLLLAVYGARAVLVTDSEPRPDPWPTEGRHGSMVAALVGVLAPLIVVTAGYLLWVGAYGPGGAFQAGAVLAALGVLLRLTGRLEPAAASSWPQRLVLVAGLIVFSLVGLATLFAGGTFLDYPEAWAYPLVLLIEIALTVSIALPLILLFSGSPGLATPAPEDRR